MAILTIKDLEEASPSEVNKCLEMVTVHNDIPVWIDWLQKNKGVLKFMVTLKYGADRSLGIHPSSVKRGACPLKLYYECTGEVERIVDIDPEKQFVFDFGTLLHHLLQAHLSDMYGDQFKDEVGLGNKALHIKGHCDGKFAFTEVNFILEIKTIKEGGNFGVDKVRRKPMEDHIWQSHMYMYCTDVPFTLVLYFCKNTSELIEHAIPFDRKVWEEIKSTIEPVVEAAYNKGPAVEANPGSNCRWCDYLAGGCEAGRRHIAHGRKEKSRREERKVRGIRM